ncbi:MAG TPA: hypothetical protein VGN82_03590 [Bosea sp. (in: a-proteobacteria)]|jgi:hypothetical protein|uniref:hypothetical protein n=1 Tax=Bosea sp. (in: a-proteobacteria) TaxID=1871050 RepID=UPI002E145AE6|nr:hypothetical protein [Bosea sp. (in: a-proteobacteria)]
MTNTTLIRLILPAILVSTLVLGAAQASEPVQLITREEAGLPAPDATGGAVRNLTRGPGVDTQGTLGSVVAGKPLRLAVKFLPSNGVPVDPESVRVIYRRQPALDVTTRVKAFITEKGIEAPAVLVPPGKHVIEIQAVDKEGRTGRGQMTLNVTPAP